MERKPKELRTKFLIVRLSESEWSLVQEFKNKTEKANISFIVRRLLLKAIEGYCEKEVMPAVEREYPLTVEESYEV
jgi:hypothetical protein